MLLDQSVHRVAHHPGDGHIIPVSKRTKLRILPFVQADGQASLFAVAFGASHMMVFIAPFYISPDKLRCSQLLKKILPIRHVL